MAVTKTNSIVVNDVPDHRMETVIECVRKEFPSFETGGGERDVKIHQTEFVIAGVGPFRRIEHIGALARPLREQIAAFVAGVIAALEALDER